MAKILPASHSSIASYLNCPYRHYKVKILKEFPEPPSEPMIWGNAVHKALEDRAKFGTEVPTAMKRFQPITDKIVAAKGETLVEMELAITVGLKPTGWWDNDAWFRGKVDIAKVNLQVLKAAAFDYKGLPLSTKLPTPRGWTTMEEVQIGDTLFDIDGATTIVTGKSTVKNLRCFKIHFDDATSVVCDQEHLWLTDRGVVGVSSLAGHYILTPKAIHTENVDLPLDPYVLGIWLADGKHTGTEISKPDIFIFEEIVRRGYSVSDNYNRDNDKCRSHAVHGIRGILKELGVFGNKHIPDMYMRAGYAQRLDLIRGIFDGDGSANKVRSQVVMNTVDESFALQVRELLLSLGQRATLSPYIANGFGKRVQAYFVQFRPLDINPFLLPRKANIVDQFKEGGRAWRRKVVKVEEVPSVPTVCIKVDSPTSTFLCTESFIPTHNTGKVKEDSSQMDEMGMLLLCHYPNIPQVNTAFLWVAARPDRPTFGVTTREQIPTIAQNIANNIRDMEWSAEHNIWPKKPSGLCKRHCPVRDCQYYGKGGR